MSRHIAPRAIRLLRRTAINMLANEEPVRLLHPYVHGWAILYRRALVNLHLLRVLLSRILAKLDISPRLAIRLLKTVLDLVVQKFKIDNRDRLDTLEHVALVRLIVLICLVLHVQLRDWVASWQRCVMLQRAVHDSLVTEGLLWDWFLSWDICDLLGILNGRRCWWNNWVIQLVCWKLVTLLGGLRINRILGAL